MDAPKKLFAYIPNDDYVGTASLKKGVPHQFVNTEYIRKEDIVAEIERELKSIINATNDFAEGRRMELNNLLSFLRSI